MQSLNFTWLPASSSKRALNSSSPLRRDANGIKPPANEHLRVSFAAEMTSGRSVRRLEIPLINGKLRVTALNDKPMDRVRGHDSANFALEFT